MNARLSSPPRRRPAPAGWTGRLLAVLLFAFHVNFVPIHLAAEPHLELPVAQRAGAESHHHDHGHGDGHAHPHPHSPHDGVPHAPHPASDHEMTLAAAPKSPGAPGQALVLLPAPAVELPVIPEPLPAISPIEDRRLPGTSPPGPRQPRGPPVS